MARRYISLDDLTAEGLRADEASTKKFWKTLENVRRGDGGWQKRPGIDRIDTGSLPAVDIGNPKQIITFKHNDSVSQSETIRPNATGNYSQWTAKSGGDNYLEIDEVSADDDTSHLEEATKGQKTSFGFGNLVKTWNSIASLRILIRAKRVTDVNHQLIVKVRISGTDYNFGSGSVSVSKGSGWLDLQIDSSTNPATSLPWTTTDVDALEIILEKGEGADPIVETKALVVPAAAVSIYKPDNIASSLTWTGTVTTEFSITYTHSGSGQLNVIDVTGGGTVVGLDASPATHNAPWIALTGTAQSTRVVHEDRSTSKDITITAASIIRTGTQIDDTQTLRVTQVSAFIEGDGGATRRNSLLFLTSKALLRVDEDLSAYNDVIGTASVPTASEGIVWDNAIFLDKVYVTNGTDQLFRYPTGANVFDQLSGAPTGAAIATFGARLCLGDVTEGGTRTPARFRWSAIDNASNWTDASSGNLELDETPGKIMKLKPIVEPGITLIGALVAYKTQGIYHLNATGVASQPFEKKLMDSTAGCIARGTVVGISTPEGGEAHMFLGQVGGTLNVMSWNGRQIQQFGFEIVPILNDIGDIVNLEKSIAVIDNFGNYVMMFPTSDSSFLKTALVFNFSKRIWTTWTLGNVTAMGRWIPNTGKPITVLGRPDSFAYQFDDSIATDDSEGEDAEAYTATWETGDFALMATEGWRESVLERLWIFYQEDSSEAVITLDATFDGGETRRVDEDTTSVQFVLSSGTGLKLFRSDLRVPGRKQGVRLKSEFSDGKPQLLQLILELEEHGTES